MSAPSAFHSIVRGLFVPGWGATPALYSGLPNRWEVVELPTFRATGGNLVSYRRWLAAKILERADPVSLAGHSMGGALAVLAAADHPELVRELVLFSPAGAPLAKPMRASVATFLSQAARGRYPLRELWPAVGRVSIAPVSALRLARAVHGLDLSAELERIRVQAIRSTVIACTTDNLVTPAHCRRLADLLGAAYREVDAPDGHIWMITQPERLAAELDVSDARLLHSG